MKAATVFASLFALVAAGPTRVRDKTYYSAANPDQATYSDQATLGYATQNGGTTGGAGGDVVTVTTLDEFTAAVDVADETPRIVVVDGTISGATDVRVGSHKTIVGLQGAAFEGIGLYLFEVTNVIIRNLVVSNVAVSEDQEGDAIRVEGSTNIWIDHCELFSNQDNGKDFYDGLIDVTNGADYVTISNIYFHDHFKVSLVGASDESGDTDTGRLHVTYANNHWENCGTRGPSVRFGTAHIFNSYYSNMDSAVNSRMGAQLLVQNNAFEAVGDPIFTKGSTSVGLVTALDNELGGAENTAPAGNMSASAIPYEFSLLGTDEVATTVPDQAGAILTW